MVANLASRVGHVVPTEWALSTSMFHEIVQMSPWDPPQIDLFANRLNHRLPLYFGPCPDEAAAAMDALVAPWPNTCLYAYPPSTIMERVIAKIKMERPHKLLLLAPNLAESRWYPSLMSLPLTYRTPLTLVPGNLIQPHWQFAHPHPQLFNLHLFCVNFPF